MRGSSPVLRALDLRYELNVSFNSALRSIQFRCRKGDVLKLLHLKMEQFVTLNRHCCSCFRVTDLD